MPTGAKTDPLLFSRNMTTSRPRRSDNKPGGSLPSVFRHLLITSVIKTQKRLETTLSLQLSTRFMEDPWTG